MSEKKKRKKKRSTADLIAAKEAELAKLRERDRRKKVEEAIKNGALSDKDEKKFKKLKSNSSVLRKAAALLAEEGEDDAAEICNKLVSELSKEMLALIESVSDEDEYEDSDDSDDEYEEEDEGDADDEEYDED